MGRRPKVVTTKMKPRAASGSATGATTNRRSAGQSARRPDGLAALWAVDGGRGRVHPHLACGVWLATAWLVVERGASARQHRCRFVPNTGAPPARPRQGGNERIADVLTPRDARGRRGQSRLSLCWLRGVVIFPAKLEGPALGLQWPHSPLVPVGFSLRVPPSCDVSCCLLLCRLGFAPGGAFPTPMSRFGHRPPRRSRRLLADLVSCR
jgi:hypothetical protein